MSKTNRNGQRLLFKTEVKSSDYSGRMTLDVMLCTECNEGYFSNACDAHERRCPHCQGGAPSTKPAQPGAALTASRPVQTWTCHVCGEPFEAVKTRTEPRFCSNRCKMADRNARKRG